MDRYLRVLLSVGVLPGRVRLDVEGFDPGYLQPLLEGFSNELGCVVWADEDWLTPAVKQGCEGANHILGGDRALDLCGQALPAVFVDDGHQLQPSAVLGEVHHEVVAPERWFRCVARKSPGQHPRAFPALGIRLIYADMKEPTSGLGPLTCSLRVRCLNAEGTAPHQRLLLPHAFDNITLRASSFVRAARNLS